jgi:TonB-dependent SusC/RagA subfamily outer membrane receptor
MKLSINLFCGNRFTNLLLSLLFFCLQANAQKTISGIVSDESGPLPGVSIIEKGTSNGTVSDFDGAFTISVANENATIVFSYLGFLTQEQSNLQNDSLDIQMLEDVQGLEEIVVTGYGTQKKATLTGSIATIGGEALEKSASPNLGTALAGKVTGVFIDTGNGAPGADNPAIRVRGTNTFNNSSALIVIDGIPNRAGGLTRINPADIESISVLKDASAAIYGARAANGVILITTKRGRKGDAIYYFNQYSFKLDNLKERGVWEVAFLEKNPSKTRS